MNTMCGCGQSDHQFTANHMFDEYNDGSFDQLFERHRQETDDIGEAFTLVEKEIVKELLWLRINGVGRESSKSRITRSYGKLPVIPKKKRSRGGDLGFLYPRKRPSSHDDDYEDEVEEEEEVEEAKGARILTGFVNRNNHSKTRKKKGRKKGKRMINGSNRKRCSVREDIDEEERARSSTSKRRKSESRALNLGFDFSDEIKALIGEDGDKDFKLRIRKKLFQTDMNPHHDRFTMPCLQINEVENLLVGAEKTRICHGDGIGVTLVELSLGNERDSTSTSQLRLKQWNMANTSCYTLRSSWNAVVVRNVGVLRRNDYVQIYSFRRNEELWLVLVKDSDHEEGRTDGVFGRRTLMEDGDGAN
ncbi:B3 domain-containing protein [Salix suchowensis]|nr:B3 domain-containing protein [Salix suchowensis]